MEQSDRASLQTARLDQCRRRPGCGVSRNFGRQYGWSGV